jgi:hypothetical protein
MPLMAGKATGRPARSKRLLRCTGRSGRQVLQFGFGGGDQPGETLAMFCREIRSCEEPQAVSNYSAFALDQEGLPGGITRVGYLGPALKAGQEIRHD